MKEHLKVLRSINILDKIAPKSWPALVDLNILNFDGDSLCVLGQIFGSYQNALIQFPYYDLGCHTLAFCPSIREEANIVYFWTIEVAKLQGDKIGT
jgi:hypothetical protein